MKINVSVGEVADKITILIIKKKMIKDSKKLNYIEKELSFLLGALNEFNITVPNYLFEVLEDINMKLWITEDIIRECEKNGDFGEEFIKHARLDAKLNDKRFLIKNEINKICNSLVKEQKSYEDLYIAN